VRAKESTAQAVAVLAYCSPKTVASLLPVFPGLSLGPVTKVNGERVRELKCASGGTRTHTLRDLKPLPLPNWGTEAYVEHLARFGAWNMLPRAARWQSYW
jgi:hypothetical protein